MSKIKKINDIKTQIFLVKSRTDMVCIKKSMYKSKFHGLWKCWLQWRLINAESADKQASKGVRQGCIIQLLMVECTPCCD